MKFNWTILFLLFSALSSRAEIMRADPQMTAREEGIVAASMAAAAPQFNGPKIIGIHPRTPLVYAPAVSGARPISISVENLPAGVVQDTKSGIFTGSLETPGEYKITVTASNAAGTTSMEIAIVCGDTLALTPPLGWNSYDAFGDSVIESEVISNALWLKNHLQPFGWDTVVVDFRWYDSLADGRRVQNPEGVTIDEYGRCVPAPNRFPSAANGAGFRNLADKIHAMGLKFGIHIMRGIPRKAVEQDRLVAGSQFTARQVPLAEGDANRTCVWNRDMFGVDATIGAGKAWYESLARQYADWGVDYVKCDDIANMFRGRTYEASEIAVLSTALKNSGRSIVLSLSPGPAPVEQGAHLNQFANLWRISNDFWDNWKSLDRNFGLFAEWQGKGIPGHWPDGDMIPFGHICQRNCDVHPDRWTRFTRDEQLTLLSLWALESSPLMMGMNLPDNDEWTTAVLTNPEVLGVDQDILGKPAHRIFVRPEGTETWVKVLSDGSLGVGIFNRADGPGRVNFPWRDLGFLHAPQIRDLWLRKDLGQQNDCNVELSAHGCRLLQVK